MLLFTISGAGVVGSVNDEAVERATELYDSIVRAAGVARCDELSQDDIVREKAVLLSDLGCLYAVEGNDEAANAAFAKANTLFIGAGTHRDLGRLARQRAIHARHRRVCADWLTWAKQAFALLRAADGPDTAEAVDAAIDLADAFIATGMHDEAKGLLAKSLDLLTEHYGSASKECCAIRERLAASTRLQVSATPDFSPLIGRECSAPG